MHAISSTAFFYNLQIPLFENAWSLTAGWDQSPFNLIDHERELTIRPGSPVTSVTLNMD
jgi:hypothetical protein